MLGLTIEAVSRLTSRLKREGRIAQLENSPFIIRDGTNSLLNFWKMQAEVIFVVQPVPPVFATKVAKRQREELPSSECEYRAQSCTESELRVVDDGLFIRSN